jgi:outer membrane protein OmpA-like peptidoglycan-associated protein
MRLRPAALIAAITVGSIIAMPGAYAQHVRSLTGANLTSDRLVSVLAPKGQHPRGIGLEPPGCTHFRQQASRGIELAPKADIAAIAVDFEVNSSELTQQAQKTLDTLGSALNSATLKPCCFEIQGYTDSVGAEGYNKKLSERRAQAVIDYLTERDTVERDRLTPRGFGKSQPIASNDTPEGRAKNRRVQIVNLGYGTASAQ